MPIMLALPTLFDAQIEMTILSKLNIEWNLTKFKLICILSMWVNAISTQPWKFKFGKVSDLFKTIHAILKAFQLSYNFAQSNLNSIVTEITIKYHKLAREV